MRLVLSLVIGAVVSLVLFGITTLIRGYAFLAYLVPGIATGMVWKRVIPSQLIPSRLVYAISPEGGPTAFVGLAIGISAVFWTLLFTWLSWRWLNRKTS